MDGDITPKPSDLKANTQTLLADTPIDPQDPRLPCLLKAEAKLVGSIRHSGL